MTSGSRTGWDNAADLGEALIIQGVIDTLKERVPHERLITGAKTAKEAEYSPMTFQFIRSTQDRQIIYVTTANGSEAKVVVNDSAHVGLAEYGDHSIYFSVRSSAVDADKSELKQGDIREVFNHSTEQHDYFLYVKPEQ